MIHIDNARAFAASDSPVVAAKGRDILDKAYYEVTEVSTYDAFHDGTVDQDKLKKVLYGTK